MDEYKGYLYFAFVIWVLYIAHRSRRFHDYVRSLPKDDQIIVKTHIDRLKPISSKAKFLKLSYYGIPDWLVVVLLIGIPLVIGLINS